MSAKKLSLRNKLAHVFPLEKIARVNLLAELLYPSCLASLSVEILLFLAFTVQALDSGLLGIVLLLLLIPSMLYILFNMVYDIYVIFRSKFFIPLSREGLGSYHPKVSIIIPVYNEPPALLERTLSNLKRLDYPSFEIIVSDESDPEYAEEIARVCARKKAVFLHQKKEGSGFNSRALRFGAKHAKGDIIGIVDADYNVNPAWLKKIVPYMAYRDIKVVNCPQFYTNTSNAVARVAGAFREQGKVKDLVRYMDSSLTSSATMIIIEKSVFKKYFTEDYITEDFAFSIRMLLDGKLTFYVPDILGKGLGPTSIDDYAKQQMRWLDNFRIFKDYFPRIIGLPAGKLVHLFQHATQTLYTVPATNFLIIGLAAGTVSPSMMIVCLAMYAVVEVQKFLFIKVQSSHLRFSDLPLFVWIGLRLYPYLLYEFLNIVLGGNAGFYRTPKGAAYWSSRERPPMQGPLGGRAASRNRITPSP